MWRLWRGILDLLSAILQPPKPFAPPTWWSPAPPDFASLRSGTHLLQWPVSVWATVTCNGKWQQMWDRHQKYQQVAVTAPFLAETGLLGGTRSPSRGPHLISQPTFLSVKEDCSRPLLEIQRVCDAGTIVACQLSFYFSCLTKPIGCWTGEN